MERPSTNCYFTSIFSRFQGNADFSDGGFIDFRSTPSTPPVQVSGCVNFGGSVTVDISRLPRNDSNITLMTFNCSTGYFSMNVIDSQSCSQGNWHYNRQSLVLDVNFDACQRGGDTSPIPWSLIIGIILTLAVVIVFGAAVFFVFKKKKGKRYTQMVEGKNATW